MGNKKVCSSCVNAKFRSDTSMCNERENAYLICQYTDMVVDCNNVCEKHEDFPTGQITWAEVIDMLRG